jgi:hypothetical protein
MDVQQRAFVDRLRRRFDWARERPVEGSPTPTVCYVRRDVCVEAISE